MRYRQALYELQIWNRGELMNKLLGSIYILIVTVILFFLLSISVGVYDYSYFINILDKNYNSIYTILVISALILINIVILIGMIKSNNNNLHLIKYTAEGEITITFETIKSIVYKAVYQIRGFKEIKVFVKPQGDKISIMIKGVILPELNIPQTVIEVQKLVKEKVEALVEIPVEEVKVVVENLSTTARLR